MGNISKMIKKSRIILKKIKELLEVQKLTLDGVNDYLSKSRIKNNSLNENIVQDLKDLLNVLKRSK